MLYTRFVQSRRTTQDIRVALATILGKNSGAGYLTRQNKRNAPSFSMEGVWISDARAINNPRFVVLNGSMTVGEALGVIEENEINEEVFINAHIFGLPSEQTINLSVEEFDARRGLITVSGRNPMDRARSIFLAAERFNLYHQHALDEARNSGWRGWSVYQIVEHSSQYNGTIEQFTERSRDRFLEIWNAIQECRADFAHPLIEVERENPPPVNFMEIYGLSEELRMDMDSLYHAALPENGPVLRSSRDRRERWASRGRQTGRGGQAGRGRRARRRGHWARES